MDEEQTIQLGKLSQKLSHEDDKQDGSEDDGWSAPYDEDGGDDDGHHNSAQSKIA